MASAPGHLPMARGRSVIAMLSITGAAGVGLGYPLTSIIAEYSTSPTRLVPGRRQRAHARAGGRVRPPPQPGRVRTAINVRNAALIGGSILAFLLTLEEGPDWG
jgi:hypothetical protein